MIPAGTRTAAHRGGFYIRLDLQLNNWVFPECFHWIQWQQECIPVGCVPPARCRTGVSPWQRPMDRDPMDRDPKTETPLDRDPLDRDLLNRDPCTETPCTETPWTGTPPGQRLPYTETPWTETLQTETPDRDPLDRDPPGPRPIPHVR